MNELKSVDISYLDTDKRKEIVSRLNNLHQDVFTNLTEIEDEMKRTEILGKIDSMKKQKEEMEYELKSLGEKSITNTTTEKKELDEFCTKNNIQESELSSFRNKLQQKVGKKNKKKNPNDAEKAQKILDQLKEIQGYKFSNITENKRSKIEKKIKNISSQIKIKEKELNQIGSISSKSKSSSLHSVIGTKKTSIKMGKNKEFTIPDIKSVPKVGTLYKSDSNKYLEIEFWEDFDLGESEANRFSAVLCAKR